MYPPHQHHHQPKRRKKRPIHGVKTVDVTRGKSGYGFTISGQHPCVLSCIVNNSPAEKMGLRPGDYLMSVNSVDVSKLGHDEVVRMVGMSTGTLTIQVAENYNSSDSSDDDYVHRTKSKYPNRVKRGHKDKGYGEKMEKLLADINHRDRHCPDGHSHDQNSRPLLKVSNTSNKNEPPRSRSSRPRLHMPVGAENHEIQAEGMSYIEAGASNLFKVPFQKSVSASNVPTASSLPTHHRVEPKQAFIKSTSQSHVKSNSNVNTNSHFGKTRGHMYDNFSPNSLQQIINHSLHSYSAANEAFILNEDEFDDEGDERPLRVEGGEIRIVVGYIGSLEMPGDANQPHVRVQSIRNAVRRLRVEQKIHTLVLMVVSPHLGVRLVNMAGKEIAHYAVERLAFSGVCPDDRRFFGIVTLPWISDDSSSDSDSLSEPASSSCHVFMVDQELTAHNIHKQKAKHFGIDCTVDPHTQRCQEFPRSTTPIILSISNLYKDRPGGSIENDVSRSQVFANPARQVEHIRTSSSSSNNSNSDSGLGLCRDDNAAMVVDMPPPPIPARERPPQLPQVKWSGNTVYLTDGPVRHLTPAHRKTRSGSLHDLSNLQHDTSTSSEEFARMTTEKLNLRAMPDPASKPNKNKRRISGDGLENQSGAENLRLGMQKLMQARQRQVGPDQTSSDTESRSSRSDGILSASSLMERPVSAPFKYLSSSTSDLKSSKSDLSGLKHDSDSSLADKLSPRAFLSSAFTPVGSVGSAFKKIRSRPLIQQLRSPSAPPIPNYHGDDEDSEDEAVNGIIKRFQKDKALGLAPGDSDPRKKGEGHLKKRDQERKGVTPAGTPDVITKSAVANSTDKWTKGTTGSLRQKSTRRNPLSLSHEMSLDPLGTTPNVTRDFMFQKILQINQSLVVFDQDPMQQKLASANSVNSIVHHVAKTIEQEQVGRVAGWAVNFEKLLKDSIGITVFTNFLKKEFSEENVVFWKVCEDFKNIVDSNYRKSKAREIYDKHVSVRAQECVNIDSVARKQVEAQLDNPTPQIFEFAQLQIFQLMKQDSYSRFLKSDLYKSFLMREMEGQPLEITEQDGATDKQKLLDKDKSNEKDGKKKGKGKENEEKHDKRRRSLLPWRQKSKKVPKSEIESKNLKSSKDNKAKETDTNNLPKSTSNSSTSTDHANSRKDSVPLEVPETIDEEPEQPKFCRVIMPDGSTTVVGTKHGQTINYVLGKLCEKRNLTIASVDVFLLGSEKPLNLNEDIAILGSKEVTIERRVLFRMDLPNKKSIGVKAKPNRLIKDVFKPILNKYGYRIDAIDVHLCGQPDSLCLDHLVSTIDSQRVIVLNQSSDTPVRRNGFFGRYIPSTRPPLPNKFTSSKLGSHGNINNNNNNSINNINNNDFQSLDEITNQIFGNLMLDKSDQLLVAHNFDELGILDPDTSRKAVIEGVRPSSDSYEPPRSGPDVVEMPTKDYGKMMKTKQKVTFALQKNTVRNRPNDEDEEALCERLKRAQNLSLDDQRGLAPKDLELPDFLRESSDGMLHLIGRESAPASTSRDRPDLQSSRDFMSEIDDYIENINDNFAAYTRDSMPNQTNGKMEDIPSGAEARMVHRFKTFGTPKDKLKASDKSFSEDGVLPTHEDADSLFQMAAPDNVDFDDPHLTDKSLTDIGFGYGYNKYLSKSRNFVNQRKKVPIQLDSSLVSVETLSPNQTLRSDLLNQSDLLESTLLNSPRSSPYSSDSSLDKENLGKFVPKPNLNNLNRTNRHTHIHSPITTADEESFLSAVDTDGKMTRHSTPNTIKLNNGERIVKVFNNTVPETSFNSLNHSHTDEVTFV